jgi:hypothetical protein
MTVKAVQMVEFNPETRNRMRGFVLSGIARFTAGVAAKGQPYKPSPIVPLDDPDRLVDAGGGLMVPLFERLTGKDPRTGDYYVSQPGTPGLPVFRGYVADSVEDLRFAAGEHATLRRQAGLEAVPAPIVGVADPMAAQRAPTVKGIDQILAEQRASRMAATADTAADAPAGAAFDVEAFIAATVNRTKVVRLLIEDLEAARAALTDADLAQIAEGLAAASGKVRDWVLAEQDARAAAAAE